MSGVTVMKTLGLQSIVRCDFCGIGSEYVWLVLLLRKVIFDSEEEK